MGVYKVSMLKHLVIATFDKRTTNRTQKKVSFIVFVFGKFLLQEILCVCVCVCVCVCADAHIFMFLDGLTRVSLVSIS